MREFIDCMLTNRVWKSGLKVAPANSSPVWPSATFSQKENSWPSVVSPRRRFGAVLSSHSSSAPDREVTTLSGRSSVDDPGDS